jgi:hypothetical protein
MADDPNKPKPAEEKPAEKPVLPPSKIREETDSRAKTSRPTVARRQAQNNKKNKK